jgi:hypothetical protein
VGFAVAGVVVCATIAAVTFPFALRPSAAVAQRDAAMPWDVFPNLLNACMLGVPEGDRYTTTQIVGLEQKADGSIHAQLGSYVMQELPSGGWATSDELIINDGATAKFNACIGDRKVEIQPEYRDPTPGERLILRDWVRRVQEPCLASHGIVVEPLADAVFTDPELRPWRMPDTSGMDFDAVLALRLDCPPVPEYLHREGIFGY